MDADTLFLAAGAIIFMGFISNYLFRRFKAPDVLILMVLGITLGPGGIGLINSEAAQGLEVLTPYVAAAALAIIMFQAGMDLALGDVVKSFSKSLVQTVIAFVASMLITGLILMLLTDWDLGTSLMVGAILGGTSGAIVIPIISALKVSTKLKMVLTLEAAITDVLVIVVATSLIVFMSQDSPSVMSAVELLVSTFMVSTMIGIISGIVWTKILQRLNRQPFSYMITIAAMLIVFSVTNFLVDKAGGGAIAVLVLGLTIGNWDEISKVLKQKGEQFALGDKVKRFHDEIAFLIRTVFFVYLGLVITTIHFTAWYVLLGLIVFFGLLIARYISLLLADRYIGLDASDEMGLFYMMPRGLAAAVMASIPLSYPLVFNNETATAILGITVVVVLLSTVLASIGAFYMEIHSKRNGRDVQKENDISSGPDKEGA
ncbi:MAG TPA: cation:proton antiporter [Methanomassiliicoccales archaeon]|nr:cation:proton antiporter [Methanomassiliicoccales archaeon]